MPDVPWEKLFAAATHARSRAYVPYSKFPVGAALLTEKGEIVEGCNVENSSYGLTICAERTAFSRAVVEGRGKIVAVAIVVDTEKPCPPCGMCRQVMAEFCPPATEIRSRNLKGDEDTYTLGEVLPHAFTKEYF